jgi:NAD(P)H-dependent flavin oxidoreductase YrpB (nitropropane dioxygenase family)
VALKHPIKLIANALGSPPKDVIDQAHEAGVPVAALAGTAAHAQWHVDNGVDIVVAQGHGAGGHTGEIASMVARRVRRVNDPAGAAERDVRIVRLVHPLMRLGNQDVLQRHRQGFGRIRWRVSAFLMKVR